MKIKVKTSGYKPMRETNLKRLKEGFAKLQEAFDKDYLDSLNKPRGLPKGWREKVFRQSVTN